MWTPHGFIDFAAAVDAGLPAGLPPLSAQAPVSLLPAGRLALLASDLSEMAAAHGSAAEIFEQADGAAELIRAHNALICVAAEAVDVLPCRFGSFIPFGADLLPRLTAAAEAAEPHFEAVRGAVEFSVRLTQTPERRGREARRKATLGRSFISSRFAGRREGSRKRSDIGRLAARLASEATPLARAHRRLSSNTVSVQPGQAILDLALLIDRLRIDDLAELADRHRDAAAGLGARLEVIGPWPPFNFTSEPAASGADCLIREGAA